MMNSLSASWTSPPDQKIKETRHFPKIRGAHLSSAFQFSLIPVIEIFNNLPTQDERNRDPERICFAKSDGASIASILLISAL